MTEQERIETLLTALERAIYYGRVMSGECNIWDDIERFKDAAEHWQAIQVLAKHERQKCCILEENEG